MTQTTTATEHQRGSAVRPLLALCGAFLGGVIMSFGQSVAPEQISPLFNSAAPVVAVAALVALAARGSMAFHALLAACAGPLVMAGYYITAALRDFPVSMRMVVFWCVAGVVSGLAVGVAVWLLRGNGQEWLRGVAAAVVPATALGEAAHGITRISDTTPVVYWWTLAAIGVAVLVWTMWTRVQTLPGRLCAVGATAVLAAALYAVYGAA